MPQVRDDPTFDVSIEDLKACCIHNWYPYFSKYSFKTRLIPIPQNVAEWLVDDGVILPDLDRAFPTRDLGPEHDSDSWAGSESGEEAEEERNDAAARPPPMELQGIYDVMETYIEELGGHIIPKMQWSCPKDAAWMLPDNSIRCSSPHEIFLLLKSSDRIAHDVDTMQFMIESGSPRSPLHGNSDRETGSSSDEEVCPPVLAHTLALRKWYALRPGREFRCFVSNHELIGICQRDTSTRFQHIVNQQESLLEKICTFHSQVIKGHFSLPTYAYDCYVPESDESSIKIIDFNPHGGTTNPLLFTWEELQAWSSQQPHSQIDQIPERLPVLRCVTQDIPMKPESALYGVPYDFIDASEGSALNALMEKVQSGIPWLDSGNSHSDGSV